MRFSQISGAKLLSEIKKNDIDIIHINIFSEELTIYINNEYLKELTKIIEKKSLKYNLRKNLTFVRIRFNDPDKIMSNINKTIKVFSENTIPYIELGLSLNRLYIVLENRYKNKFIKLFEEYEE